MLTTEWLTQFDAQLKELFAIDHKDAGMNDSDLRLYSDMPPREAALALGEDYDLDRADAAGDRARLTARCQPASGLSLDERFSLKNMRPSA